MESRVVTSWRHHKRRLSDAVSARDYSTMRDAEKAVRDLEAIMVASEREAAGLPPRQPARA